MSSRRSYINYIIIISVILLSRVSYLADPTVMLDGDECVVGLMAKHLLQGKEFPIYFWGQNYGFSLIEELFIIPFIAVLGTTTLAVKLGMLSLWTIGAVFLYKTMTAIDKGLRPFALILTLILALSPVWYEWSMKARGGYLTAFTLTSVAMYLLYYPKPINQYLRYSLIGILMYFIYESQLFWLVGLTPLVLYQLVKEKQPRPTLLSLSIMAGLYFIFRWYKSGLYNMYSPFMRDLTTDIVLEKIQHFPEYIYKTLQGKFYFYFYEKANPYHTSFAEIFTALIFLVLAVALLHLIFNRKGFGLFICSTLFIPLTLLYILPVVYDEARYLLPLTGFTLFSIYLYATKLRPIIPLYLGSTYLVIAAAITVVLFPTRFKIRSDKHDMLEVINYLKAPENGSVKYVYTFTYMMPWEIMFYSDEEILARTSYFPGRYPQYDTIIDRALYSGKNTALINYRYDYGGLDVSEDSLALENYYYILPSPTKEFLEKEIDFPLPDTFHNSNNPL